MTLVDLASIASIFSSLAVAISLIYLAMQVHQNTKHTRAFIQQGRAERFASGAFACADPEIAAAILVGNGTAATPDAVRRQQFAAVCAALTNGWMDTHQQHEDGLLNDEQFATYCARIVAQLKQAGVRDHWKQWSAEVSGAERFKQFINRLADRATTAQSES